MQSPSFKSLISAPWPESEGSQPPQQAYHLTDHQHQLDDKDNEDDEELEHTVILGYN